MPVSYTHLDVYKRQDVIVERIKTTLKVKENLLKEVSDKSALPSASLWNGNEKMCIRDSFNNCIIHLVYN